MKDLKHPIKKILQKQKKLMEKIERINNLVLRNTQQNEVLADVHVRK